MERINIETNRLLITEFDESMVESVHLNSLDDDTRTFVPDEVFETHEEAQGTVRFLMRCYDGTKGPFVYPVLLRNSNENIGYVQAIPLKGGGWEVGYHIAKNHTRNGYATEAVSSFLPIIMNLLEISNIWGLCRTDNIASQKVLKKCLFELKETVVMNFHGEKQEFFKYLYNNLQILNS